MRVIHALVLSWLFLYADDFRPILFWFFRLCLCVFLWMRVVCECVCLMQRARFCFFLAPCAFFFGSMCKVRQAHMYVCIHTCILAFTYARRTNLPEHSHTNVILHMGIFTHTHIYIYIILHGQCTIPTLCTLPHTHVRTDYVNITLLSFGLGPPVLTVTVTGLPAGPYLCGKVHVCEYVCMYVCMCVCSRPTRRSPNITCICIYVNIYIHIYIYIYMNEGIWMSRNIHIYLYIHMSSFIHTHTHIHIYTHKY